jgi:hypothetical protein
MHVKYKFRTAEGLVTPKGPSFTRAQTIRCDFAGSILSFKAPKHRPYTRVRELLPEKNYTKEELVRHFRCFSEDNNHDAPNHLEFYDVFRRFWAFYGPWFTGTMGQLRMHITLIMPVNFDHEFSLFHPRAFEKLIGDYLNQINGKHINDGGTFHYTAPVNWQPLTHLPTVAARLEVKPNKGASTNVTRHHLFFSLSNQILASVEFDPARYPNVIKEELDKRVSEDTMIELMNNIIDSFQLILSDEAKQQQKTALAGLDDTSLIKDYPPIDWSDWTKNQSNPPKKVT